MVTFSGVGNIAGAVLAADRRNMVSQNGTLGHTVRTISEFTYAWVPDALVILNSDGLQSQWSLNAYPGIAPKDAEPHCRGPVPRFQSRTRRHHGGGGQDGGGMTQRVVTVALKFEDDIVLARQRARQLARLLGFDAQDQTRIATSVSEIARNAFRYAGGGKVEFGVEGRTTPQLFEIVVSDEGPGIARLSDILDGSYRSSTGMGLGIIGARRLMDQFEITSAPGKGTRVVLCKLLPGGHPLPRTRSPGRPRRRRSRGKCLSDRWRKSSGRTKS